MTYLMNVQGDLPRGVVPETWLGGCHHLRKLSVRQCQYKI